MATVNGDVDVSQVKGTPLPAGQEAGTAEKAARDRARIRRGIVCTLLGGALWGLNGTVSKFLMDTYGMEPLWLVCVRELTVCWLFLAAAAASADGRSKLRAVTHDARGMLEILAVALGAVLFSQVAYLQAINWTSSATATIMQSLGMLLVLAYVCLIMRRRPRRREVLGIALALVGTFLVATGGNPAELALPLGGLVWGLVCAVSSACLSILPAKPMAKWGNFVVNGLAFLASGVILTLVYRPWEHMPALDGLVHPGRHLWLLCPLPAGRSRCRLHAREPSRHHRAHHGHHHDGSHAWHDLLAGRSRGLCHDLGHGLPHGLVAVPGKKPAPIRCHQPKGRRPTNW